MEPNTIRIQSPYAALFDLDRALSAAERDGAGLLQVHPASEETLAEVRSVIGRWSTVAPFRSHGASWYHVQWSDSTGATSVAVFDVEGERASL